MPNFNDIPTRQYLLKKSADPQPFEQNSMTGNVSKKHVDLIHLTGKKNHKYFSLTLFFIIAVVTVNFLIDRFQNTANEIKFAKTNLKESQAQIVKNEGRAITNPDNFEINPHIPLKLEHLVMVPTVRQQGISQIKKKNDENDASSPDIPESGQFTLLNDSKKSPSSDVKLLGEN